MKESNEGLTESELRKKAYLIALRLKSSGRNAQTIYDTLKENGIPEEIAKVVVQDLLIERKKEVINESFSIYKTSLIKIGIGAAIALVFGLIFPDRPYVPVGLILGGIFWALWAQKKMRE